MSTVNLTVKTIIKDYLYNFETISLKKGDSLTLYKREVLPVLYLLSLGCLRLSKRYSNKKRTIALITPNSVFSFYSKSGFKDAYHQLEACALSYIIIYKPEVSIFFIELFHIQYYHLEYFNELLYTRNLLNRLINLLLFLCKFFGKISKRGILINLEITHEELSQIIGTSRTTITRILNILKDTKFISTCKRKILIHNVLYLSCLFIFL
uniref:global nitrogen transcriptional regulator n=1 Tax=Glaucosphaera vacuolata TaxID=38265 RepID=UPI001FCE0DCB|nr:global nitrogen transcriptional regulator [Glaucosphaera vacuolata]UNJ18661.1 global nitrogen transcriptional regulator [Glaucosphaera vacuolata]